MDISSTVKSMLLKGKKKVSAILCPVPVKKQICMFLSKGEEEESRYINQWKKQREYKENNMFQHYI